MTTANDIYAMPAQQSTYFDLWSVIADGQITEVGIYDMDYDVVKAITRIQVKVIKEVVYDWRRSWVLATVWFDNAPVMIVQSAGRERDDYKRRYITNTEAYVNMVSYLMSLRTNDIYIDENIDPDKDMGNELTDFYCDRL